MTHRAMVKIMNNELHTGCSQPATTYEGGIKPTPLERAIHEIVKSEKRRENFTEKFTYIYAVDGKAWIPRSNAYVDTEKERVLLVGTDDHTFKDFIEGSLRKLFEMILKDDASAWKLPQSSRRQSAPTSPLFQLTSLGQEIILCCCIFESHWTVAYSHHIFNPATTIMLRAMHRYAPMISCLGEPDKALTQDEPLIVALCRLVRFVRRVARSWRFINAVRAHERQAQENFESARELIYHLAGGSSKLLILRVDLYFKPFYQVERADKEMHGFLRWLRSKACKRNLLPGYRAFLIKRENGLVRGTHWHLMVVCDGNLQWRADYLTRQLGEAWAKRTGQGPGSYHNCYADRRNYEFNGLGLLVLDDWEKMAGLRAALWYMTKADCVIKATNDKVRNFWRSPIPRTARKKLGRPRADAHPLKLLRRMLGGTRSKYPPGIAPLRAFSRGPRPGAMGDADGVSGWSQSPV